MTSHATTKGMTALVEWQKGKRQVVEGIRAVKPQAKLSEVCLPVIGSFTAV